MRNELSYLNTDEIRYWYDTHPTIHREARDRARRIPDAELHQEALKRLRDIDCPGAAFPAYQVAPDSSADVPDEQRVRIVLFGPQHGHRSRDDASAATQEARQLLENRGNGPRYNRNMLVFLAPDAGNVKGWLEALRDLLAWQAIERDTQLLNLDINQIGQVRNALAKAQQTLDSRLSETWRWLLTPTQGEASAALEIEAQRLNVRGNVYEEAAQRLEHDGLLVRVLSPDVLLMELEKVLWPADRPHLGVRQLWDFLTQYCYLPRLRDYKVLAATIREGVSRAKPAFGYATRAREDGYDGFTFGDDVTVYFDSHDVIIRSEHAMEILHKRKQKSDCEETCEPDIVDNGNGENGVPPPPPPPSSNKQRFYGRVQLDPLRAQSTMTLVVDEILRHLTSQAGADVELELTIRARRSDGFEETTMRTVSENGNALGFTDNSFT